MFQGGTAGHVRSWIWLPVEMVLLLNIGGNRFCGNIGRQHKSNGIYYIVDLQARQAPDERLHYVAEAGLTGALIMQGGIWLQKCYDPDCKGYRSEAMPLPRQLLR